MVNRNSIPKFVKSLPSRCAAPSETCCICGDHFYPEQLCPECGECLSNCCHCLPPFEPEEDDCLWFLRDADDAYDEYRNNGGSL